MASVLLIISFLIASLSIPGAQSIGVCYGRDADNLPPPSEVVALYKQYNIGQMRIYDPNREVLEALRGSNIELMLGVPNSDLENLAYNPAAAPAWVQNNVVSYFPAVRIKYIAVGTEVNRDKQRAQNAIRAMTNIYNAVRDVNLLGEIRVSTSIDTSVMGVNYPPSAGTFSADVMDFMNPIIGFLSDTRNPLLVSIYPYFAYPGNLPLSYGLFTKQSPEFTDPGNNLQYWNLFDAELDAVYAALEKVGGPSFKNSTIESGKTSGAHTEVIVTESGWPTSGTHPASTQGNGAGEGGWPGARRAPGLRIGVGDSGWPSAGRPPASPPPASINNPKSGRPIIDPKNGWGGGGRPPASINNALYAASIDNARTYNQNLIGHVRGGTPKKPGQAIQTYLFAMFNENLKGGDDEKNFGLFYPDKRPVYPIDFSA